MDTGLFDVVAQALGDARRSGGVGVRQDAEERLPAPTPQPVAFAQRALGDHREPL